MFALRWLVQFAATHSAGEPVIPRAFWVMSLCGSATTLAYFLFSNKQDAVGVLQNLFPAFTAAYSLSLDLRRGRRSARAGQRGGERVQGGDAEPAAVAGTRGRPGTR